MLSSRNYIFALNTIMRSRSTPPSKPIVTYPALVGHVIAQQRASRGIKQGDMAAALQLSQSAYSRLESGDSVLNLSQLRNVAGQLNLRPAQLLGFADDYETQLRQQGVEVVSGKQDHTAAVAVGLGLLAALLMSSS